MELEGRILDPETINYSDRSVRYKQQEADWSREGKIDHCLHLFERKFFSIVRS